MTTFSGDLPGPDLTTSDIANIQTLDVSSSFGLSTANLSWVLYSEIDNWSTWQSAIVSGGLTEYASGYDGYALLFGLQFAYLAEPNDMIGLAIELPNSSVGDQTGFGWIFNEDRLTYTGFSYYWDNTAKVSI